MNNIPIDSDGFGGPQRVDAKVLTVNNTPATVYDDFGRPNGKKVPANSSWRVDEHSGVDNADGTYTVFQRIGIRQWIKLSDATVTATL